VFRELEAELGVALWRPMRVRRLFADERERRVFGEKHARGELAPFAEEEDENGFWIRDAARVDLQALLPAARARWLAQGRLRTETVDALHAAQRHEWVIDCSGCTLARAASFGFVPWEFSKGEVLELAVTGLEPDVVLNRRHWVLPVGGDAAWVGATHEPGVHDAQPSSAARATLEASARELLARPFRVTAQRAGVRVNLPDKRPVIGRHPEQPRLGLINGLGAKGALVAPLLARQWTEHLTTGAAFDPEIDVLRFVARM
jgi:glycine/D-amino acid oxidase-like deaminating enzyme